MLRVRLSSAIALLAISAIFPAWAAEPDAIVEADDAYHLKYWPNNSMLAAYTEWWYFNLVDTTQNVHAVLVYTVTNPSQVGSATAVAPMVAIAVTPAGVTTEVDPYPVSDFSAVYNRADVQLASNQIKVTGTNTYQLTGASQDGAISWDLTYNRDTPSFEGFNKAELGQKPWEKMSWLVYMPRADVTGQLTVNGTAYTINGSGYHDHNWGEWLPRDIEWNWAQYSQHGLWIDIYDIMGGNNGTASVGANGGIITFTKGQYNLYNTTWAYDSVNHVHYPTQTKFTADNGTEQVDMVMNVVNSIPLSQGLAFPKAEYLIYEQTADYLGKIVANGVTLKFKGQGFKEYTVERK